MLYNFGSNVKQNSKIQEEISIEILKKYGKLIPKGVIPSW